ncbi:MAG TPA: hypothetical protein VGM86_09070 [Thermoanaerobaculia bacterium]
MSLKAPGASGGFLRLPGRGSSPAVDDHLVAPEVTRDEIIAGRRVVAFPAEAPHGDKRVEIESLLRLHVVNALLDSALVLRAVIQALIIQGDPAIQELREAAKAEGIARGMVARGIAESILEVLEMRGITVSPGQREEILGCSDVDRLKRWLREAILPTTEAAARD